MTSELAYLRSSLLALCGMMTVAGCEWVAGDLPSAGGPDAAASGTGGAGGLAPEASAGGAAGTAGADSGAAETGGGGPLPDASCLDPCDCDGDLARAKGACGGDDCDDSDARAHPGQTAYFSDGAPSAGFDFDCNGSIDRNPQLAVEHKCTGVSLAFCDDVGQGYLDGLPACGASGAWGTCHKGTLACESDVRESRLMSCH